MSPRVNKPPAKKKYNYKVKTGRPSLYRPEYVELAWRACWQFGATQQELCTLLGIDKIDTLYRWEREHQDFKEAIRDGLDQWACREIEVSLVKAARGYEYDEVSVKSIQYKLKGTDVTLPAVERTVTKKHVQPNATLIMFHLQNRCRGRWQNVRRVEVGGSMTVGHDHKFRLEDLDDGQIEEFRRFLAAAEDAQRARARLGAHEAEAVEVHPDAVEER